MCARSGPPCFLCKIFNSLDLALYLQRKVLILQGRDPQDVDIKGNAPELTAGAFYSISFTCSKWSGINRHIIFLLLSKVYVVLGLDKVLGLLLGGRRVRGPMIKDAE
jgi:hypothetical protein